MSKYSSLFEPRIWERGEKYYRENRVQNVRESKGIFYAVVRGKNNYRVAVNSNTLEMKCGCLYATDNHNCKHMAALCIYAQSRSDSTSVTKKRKYSWDLFFNVKNGEIYDNHWQLPDKINKYLKHHYSEFNITETQYFEELLILLNIIFNEYFYASDEMFASLVNAISDIRIHANDKDKAKYDSLVKKSMKKYNDNLVGIFIDRYYKCKGDYEIILEIFKKRTHLRNMISYVIDNMTEFEEDDKLIEDICIENIGFESCRKWLKKYYIENNLNEKGIEVFEMFLREFQLNANQKLAIQTIILQFYANIEPIYPDHPVFKALMKSTSHNKTETLLTMKNSMSEEDWLKIGKPYVRKWASDQTSDMCLNTLKVLDLGDMIIEKLSELYLDISFLREYGKVIYDYDPGILYDLYYLALKNYRFGIKPDHFINREIRELDTNSIKLKTLLCELSKEADQPYLIERLQELEDEVYGEE